MSRNHVPNIDFFGFVGITEFFQEDLTDIETMLEWPEFEFPNANKHKHPRKYEAFVKSVLSDEELIEELKIINSLDMELYQKALTIREERIKARI